MRAFLIITTILLMVITVVSCQNEQQVEFNRLFSAGAAVYQSHCQNCHGDKGQGLAALIPPLTDSVYLKSNKTLLACYVRSGMKSKIKVKGREFEGAMPASGLTSIEIAQVLTYVNNSFGNKLGIITADNVEHDLKDCK